ncbi:MAG: tRNA (adenosine(37)-N6)-threonylcarbamoyltransferase complex dimerization subunit type 1 TsaB [Bacilli bacterium]
MNYDLVIDTSRKFILFGLLNNNDYVFKINDFDRDLSKYFITQLDLFLKENNCKKSQISKIICGRGPGTFTGLRVGLTIAKTMCYALNIELYSISSIILYNLFVPNRKVIGIDDARSYKYYFGQIDKDKLKIVEGVDGDHQVCEYCDLRDDYNLISTQKFVNISTELLTSFEYFELNLFYQLIEAEDCFNFKPKYIKKLDIEK